MEDGNTGLLIPIGDESAMADALITLLRDSARATAMGQRARERVQRCFEERQLIAQWMDMWRAVAAREKPPCAS
jgi:glycosyltransferase involved in cell wall biosynthesis